MSVFSDIADFFRRLFGGGRPPAPPQPPETAQVGIRVRKAGGGNVSVAGATVTISVRGTKTDATTDDGGWARWSSVDPGPRHLWVQADGFEDYSQHFEITVPTTFITVAIDPVATEPPDPPDPPDPPTWPELSREVRATPTEVSSVPNLLHVVHEVRRIYPSIFNVAHDKHGAPSERGELFNRLVAWEMYARHTRAAGLNGKRGSSQLSQDFITFRLTPEHRPKTNWGVDIIGRAGGADPFPHWLVMHEGGTEQTGRWIAPQWISAQEIQRIMTQPRY